MKKFLSLSAAAGMMVAASGASAQAVKVTNIAYAPGAAYGTIHSPVTEGEVGIGRFEFKGNYIAGGAPFDILSYCIDLAHSVSVSAVNYDSYTIIPISAYAGITAVQANQLNALLTHTTPLLNAASDQDAVDISAATQLAAWEILYETHPAWSVTDSSSALYVTGSGDPLTAAEGLANTYLGNIANNSWTADSAYQLKVLYSEHQQSQVFLDTAAVPEPATWGMLVLGFGLVGGALRSRRRIGALAAA